MKTCAQYVDEAKVALGDAQMSDRELGERLGGYLQQNIARARVGTMPDTIAVAIAKAIGIPPGEVLTIARAEREKNPDVQGFLIEWAKEAIKYTPPMRQVPDVIVRGGLKAVRYSDSQRWRKRSALAAISVAASLAMSPPDATASVGGVGRI